MRRVLAFFFLLLFISSCQEREYPEIQLQRSNVKKKKTFDDYHFDQKGSSLSLDQKPVDEFSDLRPKKQTGCLSEEEMKKQNIIQSGCSIPE